MKKVILFVLSVFSTCSYADNESIYFGAGISAWDYDVSGYEKLSLKSVEGKLGYSTNKHVSLELRFGLGVGEDTTTSNEVELDLEIKNYLSLYMKPEYVYERFNLYGLLGFTKSKLEAHARADGFPSQSKTDTDRGFSYGLGISYSLADSISTNIEWKSLLDENYKISGLTIGFDYKI